MVSDIRMDKKRRDHSLPVTSYCQVSSEIQGYRVEAHNVFVSRESLVCTGRKDKRLLKGRKPEAETRKSTWADVMSHLKKDPKKKRVGLTSYKNGELFWGQQEPDSEAKEEKAQRLPEATDLTLTKKRRGSR